MTRLFFGLAAPPQAAVAIADWRDRRFPASGRAVSAANLHITLAFLGEVSEHRLERLSLAVDALAPVGPLALELDQVGYWPGTGICWLGPRHWPAALDKLAARLGAIGAAQGGKRTGRRYTPHITLYRGCESPPPAPLEDPAFQLAFDHFHLYASHRDARGVAYRTLETWDL